MTRYDNNKIALMADIEKLQNVICVKCDVESIAAEQKNAAMCEAAARAEMQKELENQKSAKLVVHYEDKITRRDTTINQENAYSSEMWN